MDCSCDMVSTVNFNLLIGDTKCVFEFLKKDGPHDMVFNFIFIAFLKFKAFTLNFNFFKY